MIAGAIGSYFFIFNKKQSQEETKTLVLGWNAWPGILPYLIAYDNGFFEEEGVNVKLKYEESYTEMVDDMLAGKIDFSADMVLIDVMEKNTKGGDLVVVGLTDYSNGADGIVANKEINSIIELRGKRIAVEKGGLGDYFLFLFLGKYGLKIEDVEEVDIASQQGVDAFIRGEVDAVVTYGPDLSRVLKDGDGKIIFSTSDVPGTIIDVLVFHKNFVDQNPNTVKAVLRAYFRGIDFVKNNPDKSYEIGAKYFNISAEEFAKQLEGIKLADRLDNLAAFSYASGPKSLYVIFQNREKFLHEIGKIDKILFPGDVIFGEFLKEVAK